MLGAGDAGARIVGALLARPHGLHEPVALLDDDPAKRTGVVHGLPVSGTLSDLAAVARRTGADTLLLAIPSAGSALIQSTYPIAASSGLQLLVLPTAAELDGPASPADIRSPTFGDLFGRDPAAIDREAVARWITGRRVLVTGAAGTIGSSLSLQLAKLGPAELHLLDRDEHALRALGLAVGERAPGEAASLVLADIRDRQRIAQVLGRCRPEVVFHAAALNDLALLQLHPAEAVKTNTIGTRNLLDASAQVGVDTFVNLSASSAANPVSVVGATKLAAERLTALAAAETGRRYLSVRFADVVEGPGSPVWALVEHLQAGHPLAVSDPEASRILVTCAEAVHLILQAAVIGGPGEVLVPDVGNPIRTVDLAQQLVTTVRPGTEILFTGLRPGETQHDVLFGTAEAGVVGRHPRIAHVPVELCDPWPHLAQATGIPQNDLRSMVDTGGTQLRLVKSNRTSLG